jgi:hypothetical protein
MNNELKDLFVTSLCVGSLVFLVGSIGVDLHGDFGPVVAGVGFGAMLASVYTMVWESI